MAKMLQEGVVLQLQELIKAVGLVIAVHATVDVVPDLVRPRPEAAHLGVHFEALDINPLRVHESIHLGHTRGARSYYEDIDISRLLESCHGLVGLCDHDIAI